MRRTRPEPVRERMHRQLADMARWYLKCMPDSPGLPKVIEENERKLRELRA